MGGIICEDVSVTPQNLTKHRATNNLVCFAVLRLGFVEFGDTVVYCPTKSIERNQGHCNREKEKVIKTNAMALTGPDTVILRRNALKTKQNKTDPEKATEREKNRWTTISYVFPCGFTFLCLSQTPPVGISLRLSLSL